MKSTETSTCTRNKQWMLINSLYVRHPTKGVLVIPRYPSGETALPKILVARSPDGKLHRVKTKTCLLDVLIYEKLKFNKEITGAWIEWSTTTTVYNGEV